MQSLSAWVIISARQLLQAWKKKTKHEIIVWNEGQLCNYHYIPFHIGYSSTKRSKRDSRQNIICIGLWGVRLSGFIASESVMCHYPSLNESFMIRLVCHLTPLISMISPCIMHECERLIVCVCVCVCVCARVCAWMCMLCVHLTNSPRSHWPPCWWQCSCAFVPGWRPSVERSFSSPESCWCTAWAGDLRGQRERVPGTRQGSGHPSTSITKQSYSDNFQRSPSTVITGPSDKNIWSLLQPAS